MKNNPLLIVLGEPNSVFSEILFKAYKKKIIQKFNRPIIIIGCEKLLKGKKYKEIRKWVVNNLDNDAVKLKTPEEVYYDLWYEARSRANLAREEAIKAYLEAKNIKNTYMLDNLSDSEDEFEEYLEE